MSEEEYYKFVTELNNAEVVTLHDFEKKEIVDMGNYPRKGKRCNIFCTFKSISRELIGDNTMHFIASATERARELCLRSKK